MIATPKCRCEVYKMGVAPDAFVGYMQTGPEGFAFGILLLLIMGIGLISFGISVLSYVLQSLGLYGIAKRRRIRHEWLAWIPLGNLWVLGSISDQYRYVVKGQVKNRRKTLLGLSIATAIISGLTGAIAFIVGLLAGLRGSGELYIASLWLPILLAVVVSIIAIVQTVCQFVSYYDLYCSCNPDKAVVFLVLSVLFPVTIPFFVFALRNKDVGMPPKKTAKVQNAAQVTEEPVLEVLAAPEDIDKDAVESAQQEEAPAQQAEESDEV